MQLCSEIFVRENQMYDAKNLLLKAYDAVQDKTCYGSCTACVLTLSHNESLMTAANVCASMNKKILLNIDNLQFSRSVILVIVLFETTKSFTNQLRKE
jgi:hypothetical protein